MNGTRRRIIGGRAVVNPSIAGIPTSNQPYPTPLPPLENGDRLSRHEFERRYHAMPNLKKAELIEGVVYVPSPLRFSTHAEPHVQPETQLVLVARRRICSTGKLFHI